MAGSLRGFYVWYMLEQNMVKFILSKVKHLHTYIHTYTRVFFKMKFIIGILRHSYQNAHNPQTKIIRLAQFFKYRTIFYIYFRCIDMETQLTLIVGWITTKLSSDLSKEPDLPQFDRVFHDKKFRYITISSLP